MVWAANVGSCWRVARHGDPITKAPPPIWFDHVGIEVLVDSSGDMVLDPTVMEHALLDRFRMWRLQDHKVHSYLSSLLAFALGHCSRMTQEHREQQELDKTVLATEAPVTRMTGKRAGVDLPGAWYPKLWGNVLGRFANERLDSLDVKTVPGGKRPSIKNEAEEMLDMFMRDSAVQPDIIEMFKKRREAKPISPQRTDQRLHASSEVSLHVGTPSSHLGQLALI
jgi:hypothetical protein